MCIAILNQPGSFIPKQQLKNAWDNNNHGAGIAYVDKGAVRSYHEPDSFDSFYEEYEYILRCDGNWYVCQYEKGYALLSEAIENEVIEQLIAEDA